MANKKKARSPSRVAPRLLDDLLAGTAILAAKLRRQWVISLTLGLVTATVDFYVHPGTFGAMAIAEAMVTGIGAALLSYMASLLFMLRKKSAISGRAESA